MFSQAFFPIADLFAWQLVGDFLKICSLILGYEFFAKKMTKAFIVAEILSFFILYVSSKVLTANYGTAGAVMAHAFTYLINFVSLAIFFNKKILVKNL